MATSAPKDAPSRKQGAPSRGQGAPAKAASQKKSQQSGASRAGAARTGGARAGSGPAGSAGARRPAGAAGPSRGGSVRAAAGRGPAGGSAARRGSQASRRGGTPYYRSARYSEQKRSLAAGMRASHNPVLILLGWIAGVIAGIWLELARGAGWVARAFGDSARELDPAHRRDGVGLGVLAAALGMAGAAWWPLGSPFGHALSALVRGAFGIGAAIIPVLLALLAWRLLRHPDKNAHSGRMVIGWTALLAGGLGVVHIARGSPAT